MGFKISADLISPSMQVRVMEVVCGADGSGRSHGTVVKYDSTAISSLLLWVEFRRVMKVEWVNFTLVKNVCYMVHAFQESCYV